MSIQQNKAGSIQFFQAFDGGDLDGCGAVFADDAIIHNVGAPDPLNLDGFKQLGAIFLAAFPDGKHTFEAMFEDGDKVVTHATYRGTHTGDLMGIPPTGKQVIVSAMTIDQFRNGKIVETWRYFDQVGMMQQLGVIPAG